MKEYGYCTSCDKRHRVYFDRDEYEYANIGTHEGRLMCGEARNYDREYATPVCHIKDGDRYSYHSGHDLLENDEGLDMSQMPKALVEYCRTLHYVRTDGWRGYHAGRAPQGWVSAIDTWFCPQDGHNLDGPADLFQKAWAKAADDRWNEWDMGEAFKDLEMIVGFPRTSNVFSVGLEVYIRDNDEQRSLFARWIGTTVQDLEEAKA
jgi:hypothetical protein